MSLAMRPLNQEALAPIVHVLSIFPGVNAKVHRNHWPHAKLAVAPLAIGAQQASVAETDVEQDDVARRKPGRTDNLLGWRRLSLESAAIQCAGPVAAQDELSDAAPVAHVDKRDVHHNGVRIEQSGQLWIVRRVSVPRLVHVVLHRSSRRLRHQRPAMRQSEGRCAEGQPQDRVQRAACVEEATSTAVPELWRLHVHAVRAPGHAVAEADDQAAVSPELLVDPG
mmetsp:Transcript_8912/g.27095  ORF Transcript_8912/g.27095 Transcript_8912/m.27095 type:complete len:224 (+) Transcript_8912:499-1170(+)